MKTIFIHNKLFRLITPMIYGLLVYILILLIFDSINQLTENFFSIEVLLCLLITYLVSESMRFVIIILDKRCLHKSINYRLIIQIFLNSIAAIIITSIIITVYFKFLVGFINFNTELFVFNTIYFSTSVLYNAMYFSIFFLNKTNVIKLEKERILKEKTLDELKLYKQKINPELLYSGLESIMILAHKDISKADDLVIKLSDIYRSILSNTRDELTTIENEITMLKNLVYVLNYKFDNRISVHFENKNQLNSKQVIVGTFISIFQKIISENIISAINPMHINIEITNNYIKIKHNKTPKLDLSNNNIKILHHINKTYLFFTNSKISITENQNENIYTIPQIKVI